MQDNGTPTENTLKVFYPKTKVIRKLLQSCNLGKYSLHPRKLQGDVLRVSRKPECVPRKGQLKNLEAHRGSTILSNQLPFPPPAPSPLSLSSTYRSPISCLRKQKLYYNNMEIERGINFPVFRFCLYQSQKFDYYLRQDCLNY